MASKDDADNGKSGESRITFNDGIVEESVATSESLRQASTAPEPDGTSTILMKDDENDHLTDSETSETSDTDVMDV
jgi:hypothetical protein